MIRYRIWAAAILLVGFLGVWLLYASQTSESGRPFKLGLDLSGGTHLVYSADTSGLPPEDVRPSMAALRDTIERRVNLFGVAEPIVQTERGGALAGNLEERLIVELPGVTDTEEAIRLIGETPVLDFRLLREGEVVPIDSDAEAIESAFEPTGLTGRFLEGARLEFQGAHQGGLSNQPVVALSFNGEGARMFEEITTQNTGRILGIFLDGQPISTPVISQPILGGRAVITGSFTPEEGRELARDLNFGALPVPIELISTQTIGATLGARAVGEGLSAGLLAAAVVAAFMILWYRLPGTVAVISLTFYTTAMLLLFQFIPVTLTAAGIAGFILSLGLAVDANVLIFERMKEELKAGKTTREALSEGFSRAWPSIRDGNASSVLTAVILFWFGTSLVEGFALVFGLGVIMSMLTAIAISRSLLLAVSGDRRNPLAKFLFGSGFKI